MESSQIIQQIVQIVFSGIVVGGLYSLAAVGLTLILGVMRVINLAHGSFFMLGAFATYFALTQTKLSPIPCLVMAMLVAVLVVFIIAIPIERLVIRRTKTDLMRVSVASFAVAMVLEEAVRIKWGKFYRTLPAYIPGTTNFYGVTFDNQRLVASIFSFLIIIGLCLYIKRARFGMAIRMVQQDKEMASLLGINADLVNVMVFGIGGALAGAAASLLSPLYMIYPSMGWPFLLKSFAIVILGGMGSVGGTIFASYIFGIVEIGTAFFFGSQWAYITVFLIMIIILLIRPKGFFGKDIF
jgi:branched-chain amino acid transport system permease protein